MFKTGNSALCCCFCIFFAFFAEAVCAQNSDPEQVNFIFSGSNRIRLVTSNQAALGSTMPASYLRWELLPVISVHQIPVSGSLLYTTEDAAVGTNASSFEFGLGLSTSRLENSLRQRIGRRVAELKAEIPGQDMAGEFQETRNQIEHLEAIHQDFSQLPSHVDELQSMGLLSRLERTALKFPSLGIGTTYPVFTPSTIQGVTVQGVSVEFQPGFLYTGVHAGRIKNQHLPGNFFGNPMADKQSNLYSVSVGIGRRFGNHFHLMGGFIKEEASDAVPEEGVFYSDARRNVMAGVRYRVSVLNRRLELEGDAAASFITASPDAPLTEDAVFRNVPVFSTLLKPNASTFGDISGRTKLTYRNSVSGTRLHAETAYIGPGYTSLAVPFLQADRLKLEGGIDQQFFNRVLSAGFQLRKEQNNINRFLDYTRTSNHYLVNMSVTPRDFPFFRVQAQFGNHKNRDANSTGGAENVLPEYAFKNRIVTAMSGYSFFLGRVVNTINTSLTLYNTETGFSGGNFNATTFAIGDIIAFGRYSFSVDYQRYRFTGFEESTTRDEIAAAVSAILFGNWNNEMGVRGVNAGGEESISGLFYRMSVPAWIFGTLQVKAEWDAYRRPQYAESGFSRNYLQVTLLRNW